MSKNNQNYPWLSNKPNSAKTLIERAKREVPGFTEHYKKFEQQAPIAGYAPSAIFNYSRAVAKIRLQFGKSLLDLDPDEVNRFLNPIAKGSSIHPCCLKNDKSLLRFVRYGLPLWSARAALLWEFHV